MNDMQLTYRTLIKSGKVGDEFGRVLTSMKIMSQIRVTWSSEAVFSRRCVVGDIGNVDLFNRNLLGELEDSVDIPQMKQ